MINIEMLKQRVIELTGVNGVILERIERETMCVVGRIDLGTASSDIVQTIESRIQRIETTMVREKTSWLNKSTANELIYSHTRRVMKTASKIIKYYPQTIENLNKSNLRIAILGHDVGKLFSIKHHPIYSVYIMELITRDLNISDNDKMEIFEAIIIHSKKDTLVNKELNIVDQILMDADLLENRSIEYTIGKLNQEKYYINISKNKKKILYDKMIKEIERIRDECITKCSNIKTEGGKLYFVDILDSYDRFINKIYDAHVNTICSDIEL